MKWIKQFESWENERIDDRWHNKSTREQVWQEIKYIFDDITEQGYYVRKTFNGIVLSNNDKGIFDTESNYWDDEKFLEHIKNISDRLEYTDYQFKIYICYYGEKMHWKAENPREELWQKDKQYKFIRFATILFG